MAQELQRFAYWWGKQTVKGTENATPPYRGYVVGGDLSLNRDVGSVAVSDGTKFPGQKRFLNTMSGGGDPAFLGLPGSLGSLLWLEHGGEVFVAGTNNVWTLSGNPTSGTFTLNIWDGNQTILVAGIANTVTSAALDTSIEAAMATAGYGANAVTVAGGPLNTTPITITFNGVTGLGTAVRPFYLSKTADTTSPAVTVVNTTPGVRNKHTYTPSSTAGHWATFARSVGVSVVQRHSFIDCLLGGFTLECSQAQKELRLTTPMLSLDPFKVLASDPSATLPTGIDGRPLLFTEGTGTFTLGTGISTTVVGGTQAVTFTANEDREAAYGDDVVPYDFFVGTPTLAFSTTFVFDSVGLARWNELIYGVAVPSTAAKPIRGLPASGSYVYELKQKDALGNLTGNSLKVTVPSLAWDVPPAPAPSAGGGLAAVTVAGALDPPGGAVQPYTVDVFNGDAAYT
jgi:hypothetical protein